MTACIIDGKEIAARLREKIAAEVARLSSTHGLTPGIAVVLVGEDAASQVYVRTKSKAVAEAGMRAVDRKFPAETSEADLLRVIASLNMDPAVHGILVQLPLPAGLAPDPVIDLIPPLKDVDGLTAASLGRLARGTPGLVACTPRGIMALLAHYEVPISGRRAVVVGRSTLVGLPVALLLAAKGTDATVTIAHSRSADLAGVCREADILVSAVGVGRLVTPEFVKPGAAVLDVGISRTEAGIVGDVDFDAVAEVAGWLTPMPGGTGAMTPAMLLENTVDAYCAQQGKVV
jgi:methylenetetrahydrofolate dehydrogenase (NADP+)/methenyltetrahydrofolate cyclohydrolase